MTSTDIRIAWSPADVVAAIEAMPVSAPLPLRIVLVPNARFAVDLRRRLLRDHEHLLAGTRLLTCSVLAEAIVAGAGIDALAGEEGLREHRIAQLIADGLDPPGFGRALLHETIGWPRAFASTIADLERTGLRPNDLPTDEPMIAGTRAVWEATDAAAGSSWTHARILGEAARLLEQQLAARRDRTPLLAIVTIDAEPVVARFIRALGDADVVLLAARPIRVRTVERAIEMFGTAVREPLLHTHPELRDPTDLGIAAAHLFELERSVASADRARAAAVPDGTLTLEEHDGVAAEIDATVDWVARRILEGTPLDRIAVLAPAADPWCSLIASALRTLDWAGARAPLEVAGGLPLAHTASGARVHTLLRGLEQHLGADALVDVLACVRADDEGRRRPARARIFDLVHSLGTRGGSPAHPMGALQWRARIELAEARLSAPPVRPGLSDQEEHIERRRARQLATLRALRPAIEGLCDLAELVIRDEPLAVMGPQLVEFIRDFIVQPHGGAPIHALVEERLGPFVSDATCSRIRGVAALRLLQGLVAELREGGESSGEAAIYIGTVASAAGLEFDAVRIVGLSEGSIPPTVRGDPVLPDELRARLSHALVTGADRASNALHQLDMVVRGTQRRLALSAPRLAIDRTVREPSSLFVEVGAALGRDVPGAAIVPRLADLRASEIVPSFEQRERVRISSPCRPADWHDRLASGHREVPIAWREQPATDLLRICADAPSADAWHAMDGVLGVRHTPELGVSLGGLSVTHPTSAWRLNTLLQCPHRFLYAHVLGWEEPTTAPPGHELDPITFGGLVHAIAERFFRSHGTAFTGRQSDLASWQQVARLIAGEELESVLETYGLDSQSASAAVAARVTAHVDRLLEAAWSRGRRRFVATEWAFGIDAPVRLALAGGELFVRGRIDLLEATADETFVADVKTGKCKPRRGSDRDATPRIDLQIGIYAHVVAAAKDRLEVPPRVGAGYLHTDDRRGNERAFEGADADALHDATLEWLETARSLLEARAFPRTPDHDDCRWCPFVAVCSPHDRTRAEALLRRTSEPSLLRFLAMKERP